MSAGVETRPYLRVGWPARGGTIRVVATLPNGLHSRTDEAKAAGAATGGGDWAEQERRLFKLGWTYGRIHQFTDMAMPVIIAAVPRDEMWERRKPLPLFARFDTPKTLERWRPVDLTFRLGAQAQDGHDFTEIQILIGGSTPARAEQVRVEGGPPCYEFWNKSRRWLLTGASAVRIYDAFYRPG